MFVCSCNALTDDQILEVCRGSAGSPSRVYRCLGCKPQCGICLKTIQKLYASVQLETLSTAEVEEQLFFENEAQTCSGDCACCPRRTAETSDILADDATTLATVRDASPAVFAD
ncbi:MAG: (2Fe-2S)-binding protein [Pseudomonadota bacterium]